MDHSLIATIVINLLAGAFFCGVYWKTTSDHSEDLKEMRKDVDVHDREIGALFGQQHWQREVRR